MSEAISTEEKIKCIENTRSFGEIRQAWFPPSASTEYYFVSYCHSDYKAVFRDIFGMQQFDPEFCVWYDRELVAGKDWKAEAQKHIYDFNCKGVIFYVSENSVKSPAVLEEIKMTRDAKKLFVPIVLPTESGEYLSGEKLLERDRTINFDDNSAKELYRTMLGKDITYLKLSDESSYKVEAIRKSLVGMPLLRFSRGEYPHIEQGEYVDETVLDISACNNIDAMEIAESDFIWMEDIPLSLSAIRISACAFANCANLQRIDLPYNVKFIGEYAFLNCKSLKRIELPRAITVVCNNAFARCSSLTEVVASIGYIAPYMFEDCVSLKSIKLKNAIFSIGECAFSGCTALENIELVDSPTIIDSEAFYNCKNLKSVRFLSKLERIGENVFEGCSSLVDVVFSDTLEEIKGYAFSNCSALKSIRLPKTVQSLLGCAFENTALTDIYYDGTIDEWYQIYFDEGWDQGTPDYTVHCTDGKVSKIK